MALLRFCGNNTITGNRQHPLVCELVLIHASALQYILQTWPFHITVVASSMTCIISRLGRSIQHHCTKSMNLPLRWMFNWNENIRVVGKPEKCLQADSNDIKLVISCMWANATFFPIPGAFSCKPSEQTCLHMIEKSLFSLCKNTFVWLSWPSS